jgi:hypothetical protein
MSPFSFHGGVLLGTKMHECDAATFLLNEASVFSHAQQMHAWDSASPTIDGTRLMSAFNG